jgi:hypothetical protein
MEVRVTVVERKRRTVEYWIGIVVDWEGAVWIEREDWLRIFMGQPLMGVGGLDTTHVLLNRSTMRLQETLRMEHIPANVIVEGVYMSRSPTSVDDQGSVRA